MPSMSPTLIIAILLVLAYLCFLLKSSKYDRKLPPGPIALPIVGNLHKLGTLPHRNLQKLAQKYGHIMSMRLGTVTAIVISSPQAASLFLKTHDINFANRPKLIASDYLTYSTKGIGFLEYGPYWRNIRKICIQKLLSSSKTESFAGLRKKEIGLMVQSLKESAAIGEVVDISRKISEVVEDIATMMILGKKKDDRYDLKGHAKEVLNLIGTFNLADYVTYFRALDLQGLTRRMKKTKKLMDEVLEKILIEHEQDTNNQKSGDFIDALLELLNKPINPQGEHVYIIDRTNIKGLLIELIMAAFDTSSTTIDWTISQLIRNPRVMKKLQNELHSVIGMDRMVEEKDLGKLGYLDMVVKECFRLHPVAPLLVPRESKEDTTIEGYCIPKKSRIIVNVWAIGHDQNVWSKNVEEFYPERFIEKNIDVHGHEFELIPFGSGRRICAGMKMGLITVKLVLAQLVHCFDWELPSGIKPTDIDMTEIFGLSVPRANHLLLKPTNRLLNKTE